MFDGENFSYLAYESGWKDMTEAEDAGDMERLSTLIYGQHRGFRAPWGSQIEILEANGSRLQVKTEDGEEGFIRPTFVSKVPPDIDKAPRLPRRAASGPPSIRPSTRSEPVKPRRPARATTEVVGTARPGEKTSSPEIERMRSSLVEGDRLWAEGDPEGAAAKYFGVRDMWPGGRPKLTAEQKEALGPHLQKFYAGMIEDCLRTYKKNPRRHPGSIRAAEELLDNAALNGVQLPVWLSDLVRATKEAPVEEKSYKVSKGAFRGSIRIELPEDYDVGLDLKGFALDDAGILEFTATWHPERSREPMRRWAAYDPNDVKISDGTLSFGDRIRGGEPTKGRMIIGHDKWKYVARIKIE